MAETQRPTPIAVALTWLGVIGALTAAVIAAPEGNWDLALLGVLLAFSIFSDLTAAPTESSLAISGSFLALVVAMVFLGGTPAALIGVFTILAGWLRWHSAPYTL